MQSEYYGDYNELAYLRARHYAPSMGRFLTRDTWMGDYSTPMSLNRWMYANANPIRYKDPSGLISFDEAREANEILEHLKTKFNVIVLKDWGYRQDLYPGHGILLELIGCNNWISGNWRNIDELRNLKKAIHIMSQKLGGQSKFKSAMQYRTVEIKRTPVLSWPFGNYTGAATPPIPFTPYNADGFTLPNSAFNNHTGYPQPEFAIYTIIHEFGHVWDIRKNLALSLEMAKYLGNAKNGNIDAIDNCIGFISYLGVGDMYLCGTFSYEYDSSIEMAPGWKIDDDNYAGSNFTEDWAEAFASTIYPVFWKEINNIGVFSANEIGTMRKTYVNATISLLP